MNDAALASRQGLSRLAVIGGSGFYSFTDNSQSPDSESVLVTTPYAGKPVTVTLEHTENGSLWFLPRNGADHSLAPHEINYRANLWALHALGVQRVLAVNAVGGISTGMDIGRLVLPDQLIDYTWGRAHTFIDGNHHLEAHVDFTEPYDKLLRNILMGAARQLSVPLALGGVYGCTQGPRLETAAEIRRMSIDGCDMVGMTGMPEAGLARELGMDYCCLALVVNRAAGLDHGPISLDQIRQALVEGIATVRQLLMTALPGLLADPA